MSHVTVCTVPYFELNSYHPHKLGHRSLSQVAFGRTAQ